jgi:hypothetical protein
MCILCLSLLEKTAMICSSCVQMLLESTREKKLKMSEFYKQNNMNEAVHYIQKYL